jgi:hypothetical protein
VRYIHHITLTTGHLVARPRSEVTDETLAIMVPWLREAIAAAGPVEIPVIGYPARAVVEDGGLVVTVYSPKPDIGPSLPLVTFGVAARSRVAPKLWELLSAMPGVVPGIEQPSVPWCAAVLHPALAADLEAAEWLADFEHVVAWCWVTRNPELRGV